MAIAATTTESLDNSVIGANAKNNTSQDLNNSFLTLLVAQLKNQDPTNPMQNNELTSQLAQINTVQGIEKLNTTLGSISGQINSNQSLQAIFWPAAKTARSAPRRLVWNWSVRPTR